MPQNCHSCIGDQDTLISIAELCWHQQGLAVPAVRYSYLFHVGHTFPMVIQINKSYKNQSLIGKHHTIVGNSKLDKHTYLVEYSWQAKCLDAPKYPRTVEQDLTVLTWKPEPN